MIELELTAADRRLLREMDAAFVDVAPRPVVDMEMYCRMVDSNDYVVRQNYLLRRQRRRICRRYRKLRWSLAGWQIMSAVVGLIAGVLAVVVVGGMQW